MQRTSTSSSLRTARTGSRRWAALLLGAAAAFAAPGGVLADWPTYHGDLARTGSDATAPLLGGATHAWSVNLDGAVYAEPVSLGSTVIAATENDTLYGLNAYTGALLWQTHLGTPVTGIRSIAGCGDIDPLGITGTPAIDPVSRTVYAVAEEAAAPVAHELVGVNVDTGQVVLRTVLDGPMTLSNNDPRYQQQRGALAVGGGRVYVPFGGLAGDCGAYHGFVVAAAETGGAGPLAYEVAPSGRGGGIWAPSGMSLDGAGNVFVSTGNSNTTAPGSMLDDSESVIKLSPDLVKIDRFTTSTWLQDNAADSDLGSTAPAQLVGGDVFAVGKNGSAYILNASALGGTGGQLYQGALCAAFGGTAYDGSVVYVPCTDGLAAVSIDAGPSFHQLWKQSGANRPPIIAGGLVWSIGGSSLFGLDPATGAVVTRLGLSATPVSFSTPASIDGHLVVPSGSWLDAFSVAAGTMAVEGTDAQLYIHHPSSGWVALGGTLTGAPAVAGVPDGGGGISDVYIVVGTDGALWERSDAAGWQHLSPAFTSCIDNPAATLVGSSLVVACTGSDHAVWTGSTGVGGGGLPSVPGFVSLGGSTAAGPAVAVVGGAVTYFATGTDGQLYERTSAYGWGAFPGSSCKSHPAAGSAGDVAYAACHGSDDALWYTTTANAAWGAFASEHGTLVDGPGLAAFPDHVAFTVQGLGNVIYQDVAGAGASTGWAGENGRAVTGAGAAAT